MAEGRKSKLAHSLSATAWTKRGADQRRNSQAFYANGLYNSSMVHAHSMGTTGGNGGEARGAVGRVGGLLRMTCVLAKRSPKR